MGYFNRAQSGSLKNNTTRREVRQRVKVKARHLGTFYAASQIFPRTPPTRPALMLTILRVLFNTFYSLS